MSRFKLRERPRISYYEPEVPSLDKYIYCDDCEDDVYEVCSIHGAEQTVFVPAKKKKPNDTQTPVLTEDEKQAQSVSLPTKSKLRHKPRTSYGELYDPGLDEYVFCDDCGDVVYEYCSIHGPLLAIPDDKVPSPTGFPPSVPYAALTIPKEFLHLARSNIPNAGIGVFATMTLPTGVRFGPYRGQRDKDIYSNYCWQVYAGDKRRPSHVIDASDADRFNWMRYVNCARNWREQNLVAYQYQGDIYYRTIKIIPYYTELLVFYGVEFARSLRIDMKNYNSTNCYIQQLDAPPAKKTKIEEITQKKTGPREENQNEFDNYTKTPSEAVVVSSSTKKSHESNVNYQKVNINVPEQYDIKINKDTYSCHICNFATKFELNIKSHLKAHSSDKRFSCDKCPYITTRHRELMRHVKTHDEDNLYSCHICDFTTKNEPHLKGHLKAHSANKCYSCDKCPYITIQQRNLLSHCISQHKENSAMASNSVTISCHICEFSTKFERNMISHLKAHSSHKRFSCDKCPYITTIRRQLMHHVKSHDEDNVYSCHICDFTTKNEQYLKGHLADKHYSCDKCPYIATDRYRLTRHYIITKHNSNSNSISNLS